MSSKLAEILSRSKAVMQKAEQQYGSTSESNSNINEDFSYEEKEMPNLTENYINSNVKTNSVAPQNGRYRNLEKSKMPDFIKKAMIDEPIEIPETPYHTFELDDVPELINNTQSYIREEKQIPKKKISENTNLNLNETVIRKIVKEEMEDLVRSIIEEYFDKSLVTEDIQIKVGNTVFSGKLKPLPNKRK
jgi:hypothetical protein